METEARFGVLVLVPWPVCDHGMRLDEQCPDCEIIEYWRDHSDLMNEVYL